MACTSGVLIARLSLIAIFVPGAPWHGDNAAMLPALVKHGWKFAGAGCAGTGDGAGFAGVSVGAPGFAGVSAGAPGFGGVGTPGLAGVCPDGTVGGRRLGVVCATVGGVGAALAVCRSPRMIANPTLCVC